MFPPPGSCIVTGSDCRLRQPIGKHIFGETAALIRVVMMVGEGL